MAKKSTWPLERNFGASPCIVMDKDGVTVGIVDPCSRERHGPDDVAAVLAAQQARRSAFQAQLDAVPARMGRWGRPAVTVEHKAEVATAAAEKKKAARQAVSNPRSPWRVHRPPPVPVPVPVPVPTAPRVPYDRSAAMTEAYASGRFVSTWTGRHHTDATKAKISAIKVGHPTALTPEGRARLSALMVGNTRARRKMVAA